MPSVVLNDQPLLYRVVILKVCLIKELAELISIITKSFYQVILRVHSQVGDRACCFQVQQVLVAVDESLAGELLAIKHIALWVAPPYLIYPYITLGYTIVRDEALHLFC